MAALVVVGGVYWVYDNLLGLGPGEERPNAHPRRPVVVMSGSATNSDASWSHVLVIPCSTSTSLKTRFCVKLPAATANLGTKTWMRIPAIQLLRKAALQDFLGTLPAALLLQAQARLLEYMGITDDGNESFEDDEEPPTTGAGAVDPW